MMAGNRRSPLINGDDDTRVALADVNARLQAIDDDQHDLRKTVVALAGRIDAVGMSINAKIDQMIRPQWQTWIGGGLLAVTVLSGAWLAGVAPLKENQLTTQKAVIGLQTQLTDRWQLFPTQLQYRSDMRNVERELDRLDRNHMTRAEWAAWRDERNKLIENMQRRIDALGKP